MQKRLDHSPDIMRIRRHKSEIHKSDVISVFLHALGRFCPSISKSANYKAAAQKDV